jgi:hypothetical protein
MSEASATPQEAEAQLCERTVDQHCALVSLREELEAVDGYWQRADACADPQLRGILDAPHG